ncbi:MAG: YHYH protein [Bacteroidetes bacterium]|nr:MAG: YHYH protein [Bacteroidota bacterium]
MKTPHFLFPLLLAAVCSLSSCGASKDHHIPARQRVPPAALSAIDVSKPYQIRSREYGTETTVTIKGNYRLIKTNGLPNHATGVFPNEGNPNSISAQNREYAIPLKPVFTGQPKWAREPGVAVNGVKFEPETAERFVCESGEVYRIEAVQDLLDMGLDYNHAHVQPTGAYHYHGVPTELVNLLDKGQDLILVGYAKDGFPIYYSKSGKYKPSYKLSAEPRTGDVCTYSNPKTHITKDLNNSRPDGTFVSDWEYVAGLGDLDECNGIEINGSYAYFITDEYPYVSRCLKGVFEEEHHPPRPGAGPPGQHPHRPAHGHHH